MKTVPPPTAIHDVIAPEVSLREERRFGRTILLALTLALAPAVAVGFGRFAYALILPSMRTDLGWNFQQSGALNTANALGYLSGALLTAGIIRRYSLRRALLVSLALSVGALFLAGMTRSYPLLLALRGLVGMSSAFTFIAATGLAARLGDNNRENSFALGLTTSGPGWGTIISGAILPFVLDSHASRWPVAWEILGTLGLGAWVAVWAGTRTLPATGHRRSETQNLNADSTPAPSVSDAPEKLSLTSLAPVMIAYFLFGLGYIAYMTFLVAYVRSLTQGNASSAAIVTSVYVTLGLAMVGGVFVWRKYLTVDRGGVPMAMMGIISAVAAMVAYFSLSLPALMFSAVLFGIASMPVFTYVTLQIRRHLPQSVWTSAIAWATAIFAVGQSLGPIGSGFLSDRFGLSASLWWTTIIMSIGAVVVLKQPKFEPKETHARLG
ncbi:MAG: YbfB/YjiJ family MFS transporter [bacterium]